MAVIFLREANPVFIPGYRQLTIIYYRPKGGMTRLCEK